MIYSLTLHFNRSKSQGDSVVSHPFKMTLLVTNISRAKPGLFFTSPSKAFARFSTGTVKSTSRVTRGRLRRSCYGSVNVSSTIMLTTGVLGRIVRSGVGSMGTRVTIMSRARNCQILSRSGLGRVLTRLP